MPIPKPDQKMIERVADYRNKGLAKREISRLMGKDEKQIRRWVRYGEGQGLIR